MKYNINLMKLQQGYAMYFQIYLFSVIYPNVGI